MSKVLAAGLQSHLDSGATTMVYCWRITRTDATVQGFTEHDENLVFDSTTFLAASGFTGTKINSELGLTVDNLNAEGALSSDTINEDDLAAGRYDAAVVELFWVNFEDVAMRETLLKGTIGEVRRGESVFSAELRSLTHKLQQKTGRNYRRFCDADLGDARCTVNTASASFSSTGTVSSVTDNRVLVVTGLSPNDTGFYSLGKITFSSGDNDGLTIPVKVHSVSGGVTQVVMWEPAPFDITGGTTFTIVAGCDKRSETCKAKFSNIVNFQGFPFIPGNDALQSYPAQGGANQNGGSRFNSDS
ncbi:tail assembly protein [Roseobacter phage RDJL Phi 1]|uniref:Gene transfer agent n=1 Tax=Roseobacter phage RDJL Phi 1 TaxID=562742 RepID=F4YXU3_9CAUD|nr:tail assembly protein [Roseobacter phage RDJL Phi 1]ADK73483.1 gene transfer agent [Roseobacter phage RDJL Phi 1]